jgi:hypothetical protein
VIEAGQILLCIEINNDKPAFSYNLERVFQPLRTSRKLCGEVLHRDCSIERVSGMQMMQMDLPQGHRSSGE